MKSSIGYKLGFNARRLADTMAVGTHETVMNVGDRFVGFFKDMGAGYKRAKAQANAWHDISERAERAAAAPKNEPVSNLGLNITGFAKKMY